LVDSDNAGRSGGEDNILETRHHHTHVRIPRRATMKIRVQREDGKLETIQLPQDAWQVLRLGSINSLVSEERTHSFDEEGYYLHTQPVAAGDEEDAPPETGMGGLEPTFA
jgi:hypothetical protein